MVGVLWLNYERAGHPESVTHGATEEEVRFLLGELERPEEERTGLSRALERYLLAECRRGVFERRQVPVRGVNGIYRLVGWRLAKWLTHALTAREESRQRVMRQMRAWLGMNSGEGLEVCGVEREAG